MREDLFEKYISRPRYDKYLTAAGGNIIRARKLYDANIRLAQAFHPLLSQFEVVLRNGINEIMTIKYNDGDWIQNQSTVGGFMSDPSLAGKSYYMKRCVQDTITKLKKKKSTITSSDIIAEQTFGFWTNFYTNVHYRLTSGRPIAVFPNRPPYIKRVNIHNFLDDIQKFRNRVNHCEPLCFRSNSVNCDKALTVRKEIFDLLGWIDPDLISYFDGLQEIIKETTIITSI